MSRVDELIKSMKAEEQPENTQPVETTEEPKTETPAETTPAEEPEKPEGQDDEDAEYPGSQPKKPEERDDLFSRAEYSFKRKLEKQSKKHEAELAERDKKYAELERKFAELEKKLSPAEPVKDRMAFKTDEEYIDYLAGKKVEALMAERDAKDEERRAKDAEESRKRDEAEAEILEQQKSWLAHVDRSFGDDKERAQKFLSKIQYANKNGLGDILDACPTAADYLMHNPSGPKVFEKMLDDADTFKRVFNDRNMNQLDIYYELRAIEKEISSEGVQQTMPLNGATPAAPKSVMPKIGKPGKQAGGGSAPDIFSDHDAMRSFIRGLR